MSKPAMYFHCTDCVSEHKRARLAIGPNAYGTQLIVYCENHQREVGRFSLKTPLISLICDDCGKVHEPGSVH